MKTKLLIVLAVASLLLCSQGGLAAGTGDAGAELKDLVTKVRAKLSDGKRTASDLADELKQFDTLLAEHKGEKTDEVAQILFMKAQLYKEILSDADKAAELFTQLKRDFPDSKPVLQLKQAEASEQIRAALVPGNKFPDFDEKDVNGKPLSIANYKDKVVLVDFWATWCGPCVGELPNVLATYQKYHDQGFEIIGVSLDKDQSKLTSFLKEKNVTWQQFFDGQYWNNKLAVKYGIRSIPATYLLDGNGKIIAKDLRGEALAEAVSKALAKR